MRYIPARSRVRSNTIGQAEAEKLLSNPIFTLNLRQITVDGKAYPLQDGLNVLITRTTTQLDDWTGSILQQPDVANIVGRSEEEKAQTVGKQLSNLKTYALMLRTWVNGQRAHYGHIRQKLTQGKLAPMSEHQFEQVFGGYLSYIDHVEHNVLWGLNVIIARFDILLRKAGGQGIGNALVASLIVIGVLVVMLFGTGIAGALDKASMQEHYEKKIKELEEKQAAFYSELLNDIRKLPAGPDRDLLIKRLAYAFGEDLNRAPQPTDAPSEGVPGWSWLFTGAVVVGGLYWYFQHGPGREQAYEAYRYGKEKVVRGKAKAKRFFEPKEAAEEPA